MKKRLLAIILCLLTLCLAVGAAMSEIPYEHTHDWELIPGQSRPATCEHEGMNFYSSCSICGLPKDPETVPKTDHTWGDWTVTQKATCAAEGKQTRTCQVCGTEDTRTIPKTEEHTWEDWATTKPANCNEEGSQSRTCSVCGKSETKSIPKTEHQWSGWAVTQKATCDADGVETRTCSICSKAETRTIAKTDHQWGDWAVTTKAACETDGVETRTCTICGKAETRTIAKTGHQWGDWAVTAKATCVAEGTETRTCASCGKEENRKIAKTDHDWGNWVTTRQVSCVTDGAEERICNTCGKVETKTIPRDKGHEWGEWEVTIPATCTERGTQVRKCNICGTQQKDRIPKLGHQVDEWNVTKEPTCKKEGKREGVCVRCGKTQTEKLKRVDHEYEEWETIKEATDFSKGKRTSSCRFCKKKKTEEFYPEGTLAKDLENDPEAVKTLQKSLKSLGFYKGEETGAYDKDTAAAVKKAEKEWDLPADGVAWPGFLSMLGMGGIGGDGVTEDPANFKLKLDVKQTSPKKDYYAIGDEITYEWTVTNGSTKKNPAKETKVYHFNGKKSDKKTDELIDEPGTIKVSESASGTYTYTVTKEDALNGLFSQGFIAKAKMGGKLMSSNKWVFTNAAADGIGGPGETGGATGTGGWTPPAEEAVSISKTVLSTPKNTFFYTKGETVKFQITVHNKTTDPVGDVILTDALLGSGWKKEIGVLAGNDTKTYDVEYKVTTADVSKCEIVNTAVVSYKSDGTIKMSKATVSVPAGMDSGGLYIYKTHTNLPKNGLFFVPGETVEFEIQVINPTTDKTFKSLRIYDWLYSKKEPYKTQDKLEPGKSLVYAYKTKVTKLQGKLGKLTNSVSVSYRDPDKKDRLSQSNECTVPCGLEGQDGVIVTKKVISTPANGSYYQLGEEIRFEIDVSNNTLKEILTMDIHDSLAAIDENGYRTVQKGEALPAGQTFSIHFSYVVTPEDVKHTRVTNIASAYWSVVENEFAETYSDPVTVPTAPVMSDRKPEVENLDGDACMPALTGVGDGVTQRELTECEEHTVTAQDAEKLIAGGRYDEAIRLWDGEISKLYQEWKNGEEGEDLRIAENDEAAYTRQMAALSESLALVCSEEQAGAIAVEERMEKCVGLCYELHTAPEERPDSIGAEHADLQKETAGSECTRAVDYTADGPAHLVDDQCESHVLTNRLTQVQLENAGDNEEQANAWIRVQGNWLLELNLMYDTWYLSTEDAVEKAKIAADRMSFDELINARREALAAMYPDDPATAEEVLANLIMHRAEVICNVLHEAGVLTD